MDNNNQITKEHQDILDFINETKEGTYTDIKPDLTHISYARIDIPDIEAMPMYEDEIVLYCLSY